MFCISIQISPQFVPNGTIDNKSALVQVMAWSRTGDKPLPGPMLTQFTHAYMRWDKLTHKQPGHFLFQNVISIFNVVNHKCNIWGWIWFNTMAILSARWILMAGCLSTRASVGAVLSSHPCVSSSFRVNHTFVCRRVNHEWLSKLVLINFSEHSTYDPIDARQHICSSSTMTIV